MRNTIILILLALSAVSLKAGADGKNVRWLYPGPAKWIDQKVVSCFEEMGLVESASQPYFQGLQNETWYLDKTADALIHPSGSRCTKTDMEEFFKTTSELLEAFRAVAEKYSSEGVLSRSYFRAFPHMLDALRKNKKFAVYRHKNSWTVYSLEWALSSLNVSSKDELEQSFRFLFDAGLIDGYFARVSQPLRPYARRYIVKPNQQLCSSFSDTSAVYLTIVGKALVTDYDFDPVTGLGSEEHAPMVKPGRFRLWLRCIEADEQEVEIFQVETLLSERAWTHHHQTTDKLQIADWIRNKKAAYPE
ncbi:MAG: hypothetical protein ACR2PT_10755 [Endozoicomonas sp.]